MPSTLHEASETVIGMKGEQVEEMEAKGPGREALEAHIKKQYFKEPLQMTFHAKMRTCMGQLRPYVVCTEVRKIDRRQHGRIMLKEIHDMMSKKHFFPNVGTPAIEAGLPNITVGATIGVCHGSCA